ncbi:collagen-like triple helix repeat-containing protein [Tepidicaulis sp. LMO-SS28]|uniref:collagen-like triple helix repeat-containing protein n=1 Tax=Tepidicaulis sp. LMO-SS28 TaxID=3447455 RepID=UPI003EE18A15
MTEIKLKAAVAIPSALAFALVLGGCSSSSDDPTGSGIQRSSSPSENIATDASDVVVGAGQTLSLLGMAIKQEDTPLPKGVTDGAGNVISEAGLGVSGAGLQLRDGLGKLEENDNAVGTTLSGIPVIVAGTGKAVAAGGDAVPGLAELPVFMQIEDSSGALTQIGTSLADAGLQISETADGFAVEMRDPNSPVGSATTQLTVAVRPVLVQAEDGLQQAGDAIVVGPAANDLLNEAGSAIVLAGQDLGRQNIALLGVSRSVQGTGRLVQGAGGLLTTGNGSGGGTGLPTDALLGSLGGGGLPTDDLLGGVTGGLTGGEGGGLPTDQLLGGLTGDEEGSDPVTGLLGGLTGTLAQ